LARKHNQNEDMMSQFLKQFFNPSRIFLFLLIFWLFWSAF